MGNFKGVRNTNGRPVGATNKLSNDIREKFKLIINNNLDKLQKDIDLLEPKDRIKVLVELSKFVVPTLKAIELPENDSTGRPPKRIVFVNIPQHDSFNNLQESESGLRIPEILNGKNK